MLLLFFAEFNQFSFKWEELLHSQPTQTKNTVSVKIIFHKMSLKLFERKRRCIGAFLKIIRIIPILKYIIRRIFKIICNSLFVYVSAFSGFGCTFVVGTDRGRVLVFNTEGGANWENEAALEGLGREEESREPITQICCASALDLILLLVGDELVGLETKDELRVFELCAAVSRCALNSHPTLDDPFAVQLAVAHSQKATVLVGKVASAEFVVGRKVPTAGRVVKMSFSGHCLCYSTDAGAFYVQNVQAKGGGALKLFDGATARHAICAFGLGEFALSGVHGQSPIVGLALKEPFLHILSGDGTISIFSTVDDHQLLQTLAFPVDHDEDDDDQQRTHGRTSTAITCQMENIDGTILIASAGDSLFELVSVSAVVQIEEQIENGNFDGALCMMHKSAALLTTDEEILEMRHLRKKLAFLFLQHGDFLNGIDLLATIDGTACAVAFLSLITAQRPQLGMEPVSATDQTPPLPTDGTFPEIPLEFVKQYFEEILRHQNGDPTSNNNGAEPFESSQSDRKNAVFLRSRVAEALARIYAFLDDFDGLLLRWNGAVAEWNSAKFRHWLSTERRRPKWAAKLAAQKHCWAEAFATWERTVANDGGGRMDEDELDECCATLFRVKEYSQMANALPWLVQLNARICMEAIDALERANPNEKCPPEEVVKLFQNAAEPILLLRYLDARIFDLSLPSLHNKLLELYVHFIRENIGDKQQREGGEHFAAALADECRQKLRHFLLFSAYFTVETASGAFAGDDKFRTEAILAEANEHNAVDCLQRLMAVVVGTNGAGVDQLEDVFSAGQRLCTRYPSPEMLTTMLTLHLRLSGSNPAFRAHTAHILVLLDSATDATAVLRNVPDDLRSSAFVCSFLRRHVAQRTNAVQWGQMRHELAAIERSRATYDLGTKTTGTKFCVDEQTKCGTCERRLKADDEFVWHPLNGQLTHLRCFDTNKMSAD
uniref:Uncharacterized protein n=1 Tax=Globodera rostochiensis TaxID=31243 RepID=A0A914HZH2_GLORO